MAEDWDLYAIVRSCCSCSATNATTASSNTTANNNSSETIGSNVFSNNPLDCLAGLTFEDEEEGPFSFPNLVAEPRNGNFLQELQDSYKPFLGTAGSGGGTATVQGIIPTTCKSSFISDFGGLLLFSGQNQPQLVQQQQQQQKQHQPPPPPPPPSTTIATSPRFTNNGQQHQQQQIGTSTTTVLPLRTMQSQASRSRKKKSHQKRLVVHVPAENLSSDEWAWRKYGQKPIKGSPHPRNYYRCSSSKGCAARKQVERSNADPNIFIVSYTGDHTHPRPTHRNSLAGSTRNKFPAIQKQPNTPISPENKAFCSSPPSATSLSSPTTPLLAPMDHDAENQNINTEIAADHQTAGGTINKADGADVESDGDDHDDDDYNDDDDDDNDDILIPNIAFSEDLINGLQELSSSPEAGGGGGGLGRSPNFGDNFSSWAVGSSAAATGATAGSG